MEGTLPDPTLPIKLSPQSNQATLTLLAWWLNAQNLSLCTGLSPNFRIVEKINLMHQRSMGINAMVKHDQISHFKGSKKNSKLYFATPNKESNILKHESGQTGVKCQNFKIWIQWYNDWDHFGSYCRSLGLIWISKQGNLCYGAFRSIEFARKCQMWWLESTGMMTTIISDPIAEPWGWFGLSK